MKDIYVLAELYFHHQPGQSSHPYIVATGCGAAAKRLVKKGLAIRFPGESPGHALAHITEKGEQVLVMVQGMIDAL